MPTSSHDHNQQRACIFCQATDLSYAEEKQGFGGGKALLGGLVFGPLGILAGTINKNRLHVHVRCNRCLKTFTADQMLKEEKKRSDAAQSASWSDPRLTPGTHAPNAKFKCPKCGTGSRKWTAQCLACGAKMPRPPGTNLVLAAMVIAAVLLGRACFCAGSTASESAAIGPNDDLSLFVAKYGKPDEDGSTQNDNPRPPLVTRWIVYKKERVRASYVPDADVGAPPPYDGWKLVGFQDERDKSVLSPAQAVKRLEGRLRPMPK